MEIAEQNKILFSSAVKINYDLCFIRMAQSYVENLAALAGADKDEVFQFALLMEECLGFIIDKYVDARMEAHIEITFKLQVGGMIAIEMTDIGPPIHENKIPVFKVEDENSEAGLWYQLSDEFEFVNKFNKGWLIRISKQISMVTFEAGAVGNAKSGGIDTSGKKSIRKATSEDAPGLIDLAFMTYRYSNGVPEFYDAELLRRNIDENLYDIMVVEHDDKIIGACSMKYSEVDTKSAEISSAMIMPEYRSSTAIRLLMINMIKYHKQNPRSCDFFVSYAVTTHTRSQKAMAKIYKGYKPFSMSLNFIPCPEYIGIKDKTGDRETLLNVYHLNGSFKIDRIYAGTGQIEIIHEIITNCGNEIAVVAEFSEPKKENSQIYEFKLESLKSSVVTVETFGMNWFTALNKKIFSLISAGSESIIVNIPSAMPLPFDFENNMADLNLVFCGLSLKSLEEINLSYCLTTKPVDFSLIKLDSPIAQKLLAQIEKAYSAL